MGEHVIATVAEFCQPLAYGLILNQDGRAGQKSRRQPLVERGWSGGIMPIAYESG